MTSSGHSVHASPISHFLAVAGASSPSVPGEPMKLGSSSSFSSSGEKLRSPMKKRKSHPAGSSLPQVSRIAALLPLRTSFQQELQAINTFDVGFGFGTAEVFAPCSLIHGYCNVKAFAVVIRS